MSKASPVVDWLRELGLAKYEDVFVREEVDWETLQWLTEEVSLWMFITLSHTISFRFITLTSQTYLTVLVAALKISCLDFCFKSKIGNYICPSS